MHSRTENKTEMKMQLKYHHIGIPTDKPIEGEVYFQILDILRIAAVSEAFFFSFSGLNHAVDVLLYKNYKWQNINRPFITLLLIAGMIYPVMIALKMM
jgi:hypothetical protein